MAPAGSIGLFNDSMLPFLNAQSPAFRIADLDIYNLNDKLEQKDEVTKAYNKSLLYLVSRSFEETVKEPLLGMEIACEKTPRPADAPHVTVHYSNGVVPRAQITVSETHGGFDNDKVTMNHILRRILPSDDWSGATRFTDDSLDY
jgi:hypothetical protein